MLTFNKNLKHQTSAHKLTFLLNIKSLQVLQSQLCSNLYSHFLSQYQGIVITSRKFHKWHSFNNTINNIIKTSLNFSQWSRWSPLLTPTMRS